MKKLLLSFSAALSFGAGIAQTPAYTMTTVFSGLEYPVAFDIASDGRYFITQKGGNFSGGCDNAFIKVYDANGAFLADFYDFTDSVQCDFERGLLGLCLDPNFASNHFVYAYYNHLYNGDERIRVVKFTEASNAAVNKQTILDIDVPNNINGNHVGGNVKMHASEPDKIYVTIGDIASSSNGQTLTDPYGAFLRINTDGTIPADNPFYDDGNPATGNDDRIWSYGHRNPFDFTFSAVNDSLYSTENGSVTWDEMNMIHKGQNYGWNPCEGFFAASSTVTPCPLTSSTLPIEDWGSPLPALTGILHYSGSAFSALTNHMLVADNDFGRIYDITLGNAPAYDQFVSRVTWADFVSGSSNGTGLTTLMEGSDECVYAMRGGYTTNGAVLRICPQGMNLETNLNGFGNIAVFPNPASAELTFNFNLQTDASVRIEFYDVTGRLIGGTAAANYTAGKTSIKVDRNQINMENGMLFAKIYAVSENGGVSTATIKAAVE